MNKRQGEREREREGGREREKGREREEKGEERRKGEMQQCISFCIMAEFPKKNTIKIMYPHPNMIY